MNLTRVRKLWLPGGITLICSYAVLWTYFRNSLQFPKELANTIPVIFVVTILLFCWTAVMALSMHTPSRFKSAYALLMSAVLTYLHLRLFFYVNSVFLIYAPGEWEAFELTYPFLLLASFLIIGFMAHSFILLGENREASNDKARQDEINEMMREAELHKLQQQFQPHFLFNSLNSISALIATRPEEARTMVQKLSDFLRTTLKRADEQGVTFEEEIAYLQLYLEIEKVRFGHRLDVHVHVNDDMLSVKIPTLLLQPIVENAIKFGLYGTTEKVTITLDAHLENNMVMVKTTNPFDREMLPQSGTGFGLNAIKRRLYLLFARNDLLQTETNGNIFITTLKTPVVS
ncbi:MAG TPA: histidine kinase [Flavobacteriales bacterium]|nr:histidine kinase [Flavobacteriales bacterium]